jgi:hypothetical protein
MERRTIKVNALRVRDPLMVRLINGATKAAIHTDRKKKSNRRACRAGAWQKDDQ